MRCRLVLGDDPCRYSAVNDRRIGFGAGSTSSSASTACCRLLLTGLSPVTPYSVAPRASRAMLETCGWADVSVVAGSAAAGRTYLPDSPDAGPQARPARQRWSGRYVGAHGSWSGGLRRSQPAPVSLLDELVRDGARQMLAAALQAEVAAYIEQFADVRDEDGHRLVVRNGYHAGAGGGDRGRCGDGDRAAGERQAGRSGNR